MAAVCVQRMPTLSQEKAAFELKYEEMKDHVGVEKSKLSDFELEELEFGRVKAARIKIAQEEDIADMKVWLLINSLQMAGFFFFLALNKMLGLIAPGRRRRCSLPH